MSRLSSIRELDELRRALAKATHPAQRRIVICAGTACQASGSEVIIRAAKKTIINDGLVGRIALRITPRASGFLPARILPSPISRYKRLRSAF